MNNDQKIIRKQNGPIEVGRNAGQCLASLQDDRLFVDNSYRLEKPYDKGGELVLHGISQSKPLLKNRVEGHIEKALVELAWRSRLAGRFAWATKFAKRGLRISAVGK